MKARNEKSRRSENIFSLVETKFGSECFNNLAKLKKVRNFINAHIRGYCGYKKVVKSIISSAVSFYQERCDLHESLGMEKESIEHKTVGVLSIAAHLCQKYDIRDETTLVHQIVMTLFKVDGGFDRFMNFLDPLVFPYELDPILFHIGSNELICQGLERHLSVLEYFLREVADLTVGIVYTELDLTNTRPPYINTKRDTSFVNAPVPSCRGSTPLLLACHTADPQAVLLLLRYGADPLQLGQIHQFIGLQFQHPLYVLVTKLNATCFWRTHNNHLSPANRDRFLQSQAAQENNIKTCLRYFCRATPRLPVTVSQACSTRDPRMFYLHAAQGHVLSRERWCDPSELSHLARCVIRNTIRNKGPLPVAIDTLPLPFLLRQYVDLQYD